MAFVKWCPLASETHNDNSHLTRFSEEKMLRQENLRDASALHILIDGGTDPKATRSPPANHGAPKTNAEACAHNRTAGAQARGPLVPVEAVLREARVQVLKQRVAPLLRQHRRRGNGEPGVARRVSEPRLLAPHCIAEIHSSKRALACPFTHSTTVRLATARIRTEKRLTCCPHRESTSSA